jgi:hypothetical protein
MTVVRMRFAILKPFPIPTVSKRPPMQVRAWQRAHRARLCEIHPPMPWLAFALKRSEVATTREIGPGVSGVWGRIYFSSSSSSHMVQPRAEYFLMACFQKRAFDLATCCMPSDMGHNPTKRSPSSESTETGANTLLAETFMRGGEL